MFVKLCLRYETAFACKKFLTDTLTNRKISTWQTLNILIYVYIIYSKYLPSKDNMQWANLLHTLEQLDTNEVKIVSERQHS